MTLGDVLKVTVSGTMFGEPCENIFHYVVTTSNGALECTGVVGGFIADIIPVWSDIASDEYAFTNISAVNTDNLTDTASTPLTGLFGAVTGDAMIQYNAWGYAVIVNDLVVSNGAKRFAGVAESAVTDGIANASITTELAALSLALAATLAAPGLATGVYEFGVASVDDTGAVLAFAQAVEVAYVRQTTQNSRKR